MANELNGTPAPQSNAPESSLPTIWVEKSSVQDRPDRISGPHMMGAALWSPQGATDGRDIYANMRDVREGDLVLHLADNDAFTGISEAAGPLDETFIGVAGTAWEGRPCYRIPLSDFHPFEPPLRREWFFGDPEIGEMLRIVSGKPRRRGLFFNVKLELNQGAYLTEGPPALVNALDAAYVRHTGTHLSGLPITFYAINRSESETDSVGERPSVSASPRRRSWIYAPGAQAKYWDEIYQDGILALGWDEIGDFTPFATMNDFREALSAAYGTETNQGQNARMCFDFARTMQPGDVIYVKRGRHTFIGRGIVEGDYQFAPDRSNLTHIRKMRWTARGEWSWPDLLPMKTLTEWTEFPHLLTKLEALVSEVAIEISGALPPTAATSERHTFTADEALEGVFMPRAEFTKLVETWKEKRNLVLQGAPGVGKTFIARRLAYALRAGSGKSDRLDKWNSALNLA